MPSIELKTLIKAPVEICFDLSRSVDLHVKSMHRYHEKAIAGNPHGPMDLHDIVTWKARHFGVPLSMTVTISEMQPFRYFVDEMVSGPFKWFRHYHGFESKGDMTIMTDEFVYRSPLGWLGRLADRWVLTAYMKRLLEERNVVIKQVAESMELAVVTR
ncbi:SRPBCC family protein [Mucilaginibacter daejeonensis]|uniref:SRPBCC family protein n=1 Tax=Mucilaginibacter daejeonensis TaxID=398049 RepID=UPI001D17253F|nr:SRPBCC family protein [Mucilaginibacter daejeonensis]UEG52505.1 SRPBCC family protein [Mucilaginibacter daejeonensis]